jgi:hypothetical protein
MPRTIYEAHHAVLELGIQPGDFVVIDPSHEHEPFHLVRRLDTRDLPALLPHLPAFTLCRAGFREGPPSDARRRLRIVR